MNTKGLLVHQLQKNEYYGNGGGLETGETRPKEI
jgi:hypothetical protein